MSKEQFAAIAAQRADPSIPWPARGSGGRELVEHEGWERRTIPVMSYGKPKTMEAMCRGQLAVNVMLEGEGFAICVASSGARISYSGRVFARCIDAMAAADAMMEADATWDQAPTVGLTAHQRETLRLITDAAEQRGEILLDMVFPS